MNEVVFYTNPMQRGRTVRWLLEAEAEAAGDQARGLGFEPRKRVSDREAYRRAPALDDALTPLPTAVPT